MELEIKLTRNKVALVDSADFEYLNKFKWRCSLDGRAIRWTTVKEHGKRQKRNVVFMHREVLTRMGFNNFKMVDHINHDTLDNRRLNLRPVDYCLNSANTLIKKNNTSGFKGVGWIKKNKKWSARIKFNGKDIWLGSNIDIKKAIEMYDNAAKKYFGDYSLTNKQIYGN